MTKLIMTDYTEIRDEIKAGDDIVFGGNGVVSTMVKVSTNSPVSHIASAFMAYNDFEGKKRIKLIESTSLDGFNGVVTPFLSERIKTYEGNIWWCPLSFHCRKNLDEKLFFSFMKSQIGKKYDIPQAIKSALDIYGMTWDDNEEDLSKLFCSELRTSALDFVGVIKEINASETTPIDCCTHFIHGNEYYQIKGKRTIIPKYNTVIV